MSGNASSGLLPEATAASVGILLGLAEETDRGVPGARKEPHPGPAQHQDQGDELHDLDAMSERCSRARNPRLLVKVVMPSRHPLVGSGRSLARWFPPSLAPLPVFTEPARGTREAPALPSPGVVRTRPVPSTPPSSSSCVAAACMNSAGSTGVLSGVLQPIMPLDLPVKVRSWELTVYPRSHIRRWFGVTRPAQARM